MAKNIKQNPYKQPVKEKQKGLKHTPPLKIEKVVGVTLPRAVKIMAALCHPTNRHQQSQVQRLYLKAIVDSEIAKRTNKKHHKPTPELDD